MKTISLLFCSCLIAAALQAQIIHVPGDYPTIQQGINAAMNGDTVLVDPGTYLENIDLNGKDITVASLFLTTQDPAFISQTIIDGNYEWMVMYIKNCSPLISGFTITHGYIPTGGQAGASAGIECYKANPILQNMIIQGNSGSGFWGYYYSNPSLQNVTITGNTGGGIGCFFHSNLSLTNVTVKENSGGGISCAEDCSITFDSIKRCNIYNNAALVGSDIYSESMLDVIVDTFTVINPSQFHASPLPNFSFDILHGYFNQTNTDLFVSPLGNNLNSGLTADDPLKTIHVAQSRMLADSLNPHTIHLLDGKYSPSSNGEFFPIFPTDHISLKGTADTSVILDSEGPRVMQITDNSSSVISGITITGGHSSSDGGGIYCSNSNPKFANVRVTNNSAVHIDLHVYVTRGGGIFFENSTPTLQNVIISGNTAYWGVLSGSSPGLGGGIFSTNSNLVLQNVLITGNSSGGNESAIHCSYSNLSVENSTIADNNGCEIFSDSSTLAIINSIIWNSDYEEITGTYTANVSYSDIPGGWAGEGNIDEDPLFVDNGLDSLALILGSPCIDAGTPDTTGLFLPQYDLMGNPRIWNGRVDMGAYEWNNVGINKNIIQNSGFEVKNYPNPFCDYTNFEYELKENAAVTLTILNRLGQVVIVLANEQQSKGIHKVEWHSEGLPAGIYFVRQQNEKMVTVEKLVKY